MKMKKSFLLGMAALAAISCAQESVQVEIVNPTAEERNDETVEIAWEALTARLAELTPERVVVRDDEGKEIPSQVLYLGGKEPRALLFQIGAEGGERLVCTVAAGERSPYERRAYGRQVPERYDDYAWENDKVVYRLYGPALETSPEKLITPGIDVWVKSTERLVIDERYARGHYHDDLGDGMDCYKVGVTLGAGASLPLVGGKLHTMKHNYATQQTLDNGPIRTSVRLTYAPFDVEGRSVTLTKTISLDAGARFSRMENSYAFEGEGLPIAAGVVRHDVKELTTGDGWLALCEAASDSADPTRDGDIYLGIVLPDATILPDTLGHALAVKTVRPDEPLVYYAGSGWSKGGIDDMEEWTGLTEAQLVAATAPLRVTLLD